MGLLCSRSAPPGILDLSLVTQIVVHSSLQAPYCHSRRPVLASAPPALPGHWLRVMSAATAQRSPLGSCKPAPQRLAAGSGALLARRPRAAVAVRAAAPSYSRDFSAKPRLIQASGLGRVQGLLGQSVDSRATLEKPPRPCPRAATLKARSPSPSPWAPTPPTAVCAAATRSTARSTRMRPRRSTPSSARHVTSGCRLLR